MQTVFLLSPPCKISPPTHPHIHLVLLPHSHHIHNTQLLLCFLFLNLAKLSHLSLPAMPLNSLHTLTHNIMSHNLHSTPQPCTHSIIPYLPLLTFSMGFSTYTYPHTISPLPLPTIPLFPQHTITLLPFPHSPSPCSIPSSNPALYISVSTLPDRHSAPSPGYSIVSAGHSADCAGQLPLHDVL